MIVITGGFVPLEGLKGLQLEKSAENLSEYFEESSAEGTLKYRDPMRCVNECS